MIKIRQKVKQLAAYAERSEQGLREVEDLTLDVGKLLLQTLNEFVNLQMRLKESRRKK